MDSRVVLGKNIRMKLCFFVLVGAFIAVPAMADSLEGLWRTECVFVPKKHSAINQITFKNKFYIATTTMFATQDCQNENLSVVVKGHFKIGKNTSDFYHTPESVEMTLKSIAVVEHYRKYSVCGISDWVLGQTRNVAGMFCDPYEMPKANQLSFDIFELKDNFLTFGGFPRKTFPYKNDRPTEFYYDWKYSKL